MRRVAVVSALIAVGMVTGCAQESTMDTEVTEQGLTVLTAEVGHVAVAYREGDVVIYMEAKRGNETPELYQFDSNSPLFEVDARFMADNGFTFHAKQGGDGWVDPAWGEAWDRQLRGEIGITGTGEVLFRMATEAAATLYADIERQVGPELAAKLAPEIDSIYNYASVAYTDFQTEHEARRKYLVEQGLEPLPAPGENGGEVTYGTTGPEDSRNFIGNVTSAKIQLRADKLDGIPGWAGGWHSATKRYYWKGSSYYSHSNCNHGGCASNMTYRSGSGYKDFTGSNYLRAYTCTGDYKWDSDGGYYGHNCHDDSRIQMYNYRYALYTSGHFRWCDGRDRSHDISVDKLFVELDQDGYPFYGYSTNKGYYN